MGDQMFTGVRNERLYEKIVVQFRELIQEGRLRPGDRLLGERELASQRATVENIEKIERVLMKMEDQLKYPDEKVEGDSSFHLALAEATQNFVFVSMMETNLNMVRQVRKQTLTSPERYLQSLAEHRAIFEAVKNRDTSDAVEATWVHLKKLRENVLKNYLEL